MTVKYVMSNIIMVYGYAQKGLTFIFTMVNRMLQTGSLHGHITEKQHINA